VTIPDFESLTELEQREYKQLTGLSPLERRDDSSLVSNGFFYASAGNIHRWPQGLRHKLLVETWQYLSDEKEHVTGMQESSKIAKDAPLANAIKRLELYKRFYIFITEKFK
jgi:hypothetical protein